MQNYIPNNAAENYDLSTQYRWFCRLAEPNVNARLENDPEFSKEDWLVQCFSSIEEFQHMFPDRDVCQKMLLRLEEDLKKIDEPVHPVEIIKMWPKFLEDMDRKENI